MFKAQNISCLILLIEFETFYLNLKILQMLNCILGMVEKTQRAITILQQRQSSQHLQHGLRTPEDIIDEVQTSAVRAVNEVRIGAKIQGILLQELYNMIHESIFQNLNIF